MVATNELEIRDEVPGDRQQINDIRRQFSGEVLIDDPDVKYVVASQGREILAVYGYKLDGTSKRALIVDLYGKNARAWMTLYHHLISWADRLAIQISGWVSVKNPHIKTFWRTGCVPEAVLVRREPRA